MNVITKSLRLQGFRKILADGIDLNRHSQYYLREATAVFTWRGNNCCKEIHLSVPQLLTVLKHGQDTHLYRSAEAQNLRQFSSTGNTSGALSSNEVKQAIQHLTDQFMEARELLDDARESIGTVYFSDDMEEAQIAVKDTLEHYQTLLSRLSEDQKQEVLRTIGLKMEELRAQERAIKDTLHDDH